MCLNSHVALKGGGVGTTQTIIFLYGTPQDWACKPPNKKHRHTERWLTRREKKRFGLARYDCVTCRLHRSFFPLRDDWQEKEKKKVKWNICIVWLCVCRWKCKCVCISFKCVCRILLTRGQVTGGVWRRMALLTICTDAGRRRLCCGWGVWRNAGASLWSPELSTCSNCLGEPARRTEF